MDAGEHHGSGAVLGETGALPEECGAEPVGGVGGDEQVGGGGTILDVEHMVEVVVISTEVELSGDGVGGVT